ncbi:MAG: hypothetical protein HZB75_05070 [Candidatus Saccharibacteria bacterium]|jgi:glucan phosphoethanolaminetransferase (alkaline phosphatase superfamily)|nr:MAG: hypothetical protein HZB75_05070 [Candidatus Saccharibacteria bacterium]
MKKWKQIIMSLALVAGVGAVALPAPSAMAINVFDQCADNPDTAVCKAQGTDNASSMVKIIINTLLIVLGMIAVIMIVIGGIRYTTSNGDSSAIKGAKDTILYAVVGLIVAIMSYAIVNFVVGAF